MALDIYTNNYSIIAQNNLTSANNLMTKSIERLSSGLRINHASDDASGLAISEKLRAQIRGLDRANMNAQDAVSFLQTAEGGMEVIGDMVQRMRELAVQAGNGTYTTNDRKELQKEIDQLKEEVNRISASTEYNTKKLLTGDAAGLWSASSNSIEAIIKGAPAEGNYKLEITTTPGENAVYKSDIMDLKETKAIATKTDTTKTNPTRLESYNLAGTYNGTGSLTLTMNSTAVTSAGSTATAIKAGTYTAAVASITSGTTQSGYYILEATGNSVSATGTTEMTMTWIDASTGKSEKIAQNVTFEAGGSATTATFTLADGSNVKITFADLATVKIEQGQSWYGKQQAGVASAGLTAAFDDGNADTAELSVSVKTTATAGGTSAYAFSINKTTGEYSVIGMDATWNGDLANTATTGVFFAQSFDVSMSSVADGNTKLAEIGRFTNADGRMILDNTQELIVYGNGGQSTINVEGCDTVNDFKTKLTNALVELGMGATAESAGSQAKADEINKNLVQFVTESNKTSTGNNAVVGTFVIQSALLGKDSEISFAGDESLVNAFSLATIQESSKSQTNVKVFNAHTGENIGEDTVCDGVLRGVIKGVDVKVDSSLGTTAAWNTTTNSIDFTKATTASTAFLHVVDNRTEVQVGANEGQTFDISIGRMDTTALGIDDAYVTTMGLSQKAITKFDQALEKVNSSRATIGAQINRLEYTQKNLSVSAQNLTAAESRIRDLDVASESAVFARNNILVNSAVAMLAQANQLPQVALQLIGR